MSDDAVEAHVDALLRERAELEASSPRRAEIARELAALRVALAESRRVVALRVLSSIGIAAPCKASWNAMQGDDRARHCSSCDRNVFDLSALDAVDAVALLARHGALCARIRRRADGTVIDGDCSRRRRRRRIAVAGAALLALGTTAGVAAYATRAPEPASLTLDEVHTDSHVSMGLVRYVDPEPKPTEPPDPKTEEDAPIAR